MRFSVSKGVKLALLTSLISGVSIFVNKFGVSLVKPPLFYATLKNTMVGLLILSIVIAFKKIDEIRLLKKNEWIKLSLIGLVGGSLPFYLFFESLSQTSPVNAVMIHKTLVFWIALLALPFLKEKLTKLQLLSVVMLLLSNLLVGGFTGFSFDRGELMALVATMLWAVENVIAKKTLKTVSADLVTLFRMGLGSLVLWGFSLYKGLPVLEKISSLSLQNWSILLVVSGFLFAYVWSWYRALKAEKAVVVSAVLVSSTIITNLLSAVFITHKLSQGHLLQMGVIALGLAVFLRENNRMKIELA